MKVLVHSLGRRVLKSFGAEGLVSRLRTALREVPADTPAADREILDAVRPYTRTSVARLLAQIDAVRYISRNRIPGDIVECGVWRGGSMMAAALALLDEGDTSRRLYLYDTFEGMSEPTEHDKDLRGRSASVLLAAEPADGQVRCLASLEDVQQNMRSTGYPDDLVQYVPGMVEETIPNVVPEEVALLRLDTDWYESTHHELTHMYPLLTTRGVLIIDDYGHWQGARKATDEYFAAREHRPFLHRIDYTGRLLVKPA